MEDYKKEAIETLEYLLQEIKDGKNVVLESVISRGYGSGDEDNYGYLTSSPSGEYEAKIKISWYSSQSDKRKPGVKYNNVSPSDI